MDDYRSWDEAERKMMYNKLRAFETAAKKFIEKVDSGRARSVETYRELKAALKMPEKIS